MKKMLIVAVILVACRGEDNTTPPKPAPTTTVATTTTSAAPPADLKGKKVEARAPLRPAVVSQCLVGARLDANGAVPAKMTTFTTKERVYVTMTLTEAPKGLVVSARAMDEKEKEVAADHKPAAGLKQVTLQLEPLPAGKYVIESLWGGNIVCDEKIEVKR
ncbi:MAG TPA: hypothetical protein VG106_12780 [Vicinamibacterales bacterium]|nr:hypothetical protein [Vicinamibacterales bacterium]